MLTTAALGAWRPATPESWWMQEALMAEAAPIPAPPLLGDARSNVCIVGGGYLGLWTALRLRELAPELTITVLEARICGSGASGRNGGLAIGYEQELDELEEAFGHDQAAFLAREVAAGLAEMEAFGHRHDIDLDMVASGHLSASAAPAQDRGADATVRAPLVHLSGSEVRGRVGSPVLREATLASAAAALHPAKLVRGLRRVALEQDIRVHEMTPVVGFDLGRRRLRTASGSITADRIVLATNAWAARLPEVAPYLFPLSSHVVITQPARAELEAMGWTDRVVLSDRRLLVHYAQVTRDWRLVFGRGGGALGPFGRITPRVMFDQRLVTQVERDLRRFFPQLAHVPIVGAWGGAVDRGPRPFPFFASVGSSEVFVGAGFSGTGILPAMLGAKILASLVLGHDDPYSRCSLVGLPRRRFPPEPLRAAAGAVVRSAIARKEDLEEQGRRPGAVIRGVASLLRHNTLPASGRGGRQASPGVEVAR